MSGRIGFIGVGQMGAPMVERLLASGREVAVFDVNAAAMQPLVARGAVAAGSAREA
ncbi:MAG: NAD(P)-binding domain-containing protein, partial [Bacteroidota bacterium]